MINKQQFERLKIELKKIKDLPEGWGGRKQNNRDDDKIDLFSIENYEDLLEKINSFDKETKEYYLKRWFIIKVSDCDEYLFSTFSEVLKNPNKYSKKFDFIIKGYKFDIKGTRIPFKFKNKLKEIYSNPKEIIDFYYSEQSIGRRFGIQNRLFIVTIDEENYTKELFLRRNFELKKGAFKRYLHKLNSGRKFFEINFQGKKLISDIIFIIKKGKETKILIASDILN